MQTGTSEIGERGELSSAIEARTGLLMTGVVGKCFLGLCAFAREA